LFLELSGEDVVDPDAAVAQLEAVAAQLQMLTDQERAAVVDELIAVGKAHSSPREQEFILDLPGSLGLL
jgi:hypothetical protein